MTTVPKEQMALFLHLPLVQGPKKCQALGDKVLTNTGWSLFPPADVGGDGTEEYGNKNDCQ